MRTRQQKLSRRVSDLSVCCVGRVYTDCKHHFELGLAVKRCKAADLLSHFEGLQVFSSLAHLFVQLCYARRNLQRVTQIGNEFKGLQMTCECKGERCYYALNIPLNAALTCRPSVSTVAASSVHHCQLQESARHAVKKDPSEPFCFFDWIRCDQQAVQ